MIAPVSLDDCLRQVEKSLRAGMSLARDRMGNESLAEQKRAAGVVLELAQVLECVSEMRDRFGGGK